jgi:prolipoprotein diacylglyceryltransferase
MENRKIIIIAVLLMLSVVNFYVMNQDENIRTIAFLKIFVVGFLFSRLVFLLIEKHSNNS